jgi:hypothetical protein
VTAITAIYHRTGAIKALTALIRDGDPLYRPGEFLLGYTLLSEGDAAGAAAVFSRLVKRFDDEAFQRIRMLAEGWRKEQPTWMRRTVGSRIHFVKEWELKYQDFLLFAHGGPYFAGMDLWERLKDLLDNPDADRNSATVKSTIDHAVHTLGKLVGELPAAAVGAMTSLKVSEQKARELLDDIFNTLNIMLFRSVLEGVDFGIWSHSVKAGDDSTVSYPSLNELMLLPLGGIVFRDSLERLKTLLDEKNWPAAREAIGEIERSTRLPNMTRFTTVLNDGELESWKARVASWFIPPLAHAMQLRADLRQPLHMESAYYLALSLLMKYELDDLNQAWQRALTFRQTLPSDERWRRLQLLTLCLEGEARIRYFELSPDDPGFRFVLTTRDRTKIAEAAEDKGLDRTVRAAALTCLGLFERRDRRQEMKAARRRRSSLTGDERTRLVFPELEKYLAALKLKESASLHCCMAEVLLEAKRNEDAVSHLRQALLLAPKHVLANKLSADMQEPA